MLGSPLFCIKAPVAVPTANFQDALACEIDCFKFALNEAPHATMIFCLRDADRTQPVAEIKLMIPMNRVDLFLQRLARGVVARVHATFPDDKPFR